MIYLDNNATTAIADEALAAMLADWRLGPANPSSQHAAGRAARLRLEDATDSILEMLSATNHRFLITSGGTEANNWVISLLGKGSGPIIVSQIEHPSILQAAARAEACNQTVLYLPVNSAGVVDLNTLAQWLSHDPPPRLVSVMMANNETGVVQPIRDIARLCNDVGVPFHTDASQALGKLPVSIDELDVTAATVAAHKFHGPIGVGGLVLKKLAPIFPLLVGGAQQLDYRGGTEPTALVVGMQVAMSVALNALSAKTTAMMLRRQRLEQALLRCIPDVVIHGCAVERLPQTTCFSVPMIDRQALFLRLDFAGVACSTGSACASGSSEPSHVLQAMGVEHESLSSAIRLSACSATTDSDIDTAVDCIVSGVNKLRSCQDV
ncbi:MAG: cysteine desulfurase family protein [Pirellulaceae bacterium]